jgi:hypothetical protein
MARKRFKPEQIIHMLREAEIKLAFLSPDIMEAIIAGYWSLSATSHRRSWKWRIIANWKSRPWRPDSN